MKHECEYCNRSFDRSYNLKRHVRKVHNRYLETENSESSDNGNASHSNNTDSNESNDTDSNHSDDSHSKHSNDTDSNESNANTSDTLQDETDLNDDEWNSYTEKLENLMLETYDDTHNQMTALQDEGQSSDMSEESKELVMATAKKQFRKKLVNYLIIVYGLQDDATYGYLFNKIDKYRDKKIDFSTAISMAVKSSSALIDKDFEKVINDTAVDSSTDNEESGEDMDVA